MSENKLKIIAHYWSCECVEEECVSNLQETLKLSQTNLSKHLTALKEEGVLDVKVVHRQRYYSLNQEFKKKWFDVLDPIISYKEVSVYKCTMCKEG